MNHLKPFACILALGLLMGCAACTRSGIEDPVTGDGGGNDFTVTLPENAERGTHKVSVKEGTHDLVKDGQTSYTVVLPKDSDEVLTFAASELSSFLAASFGPRMETVEDEGLTLSQNSEYFVIGKDNALAAGIDLPAGLGTRGAYVETRGNAVFLLGETSTGALNAVYEWLHYAIGFEAYGTDEIVYETGADLKLKDIEITEVPDIESLATTFGWTDTDLNTCRRLRYTFSYWLSVGGSSYHNSFLYLPKATYRQDHGEWYSTDGMQLCYTAHGDEESLDEMISAVADNMKKELIRDTELTHVTITQEDVATWCTCPACRELNEKYGTDAVSVIRFCNRVSRTIRAWFETEEGKPYARDLKIGFFAYHATQPAPVTYDAATDSYAPIDDTVLCDDDVGVIYAPIRATYQKPLSDPYNDLYYKTVRGWAAVTKNLYMWTYATNFHYYLVPTNTYNSMQFNYRFLQESGAKWLLDQNQYSVFSTGFTALKMYLNTKLAWNTSLDMEELVRNWFDATFGPAAPRLYAVFEELRAHWLYLEEECGYIGDCYLEPLNEKYWPVQLLKKWTAAFEAAQEDIAPVRETDRLAHSVYSGNITLESLSFRFLLLDVCASSFDAETLTALREQFREDCSACGLTNYSERAQLSDLWSSWGI